MNNKMGFCLMLSFSALLPQLGICAPASDIPNRMIDSAGFMRDAVEAQKLRSQRRIGEDEFRTWSQRSDVVVLDARSTERYREMHIAGAKHLNFADFTADALAGIIPSKDTKILIYCNNNIENAPRAFPTKAFTAALNLSTFNSLYSYGYRNVYELGPVIDPEDSKIEFEGSLLD